jgi:hypothetical protein
MNQELLFGKWNAVSFEIDGVKTYGGEIIGLNIGSDMVVKAKYHFNGRWNNSPDIITINADAGKIAFMEGERLKWYVKDVDSENLVLINQQNTLIYYFKRV